MGRKSKIEKHDLQERVKELKADGHSNKKIAETLENESDINISRRAVDRFLSKKGNSDGGDNGKGKEKEEAGDDDNEEENKPDEELEGKEGKEVVEVSEDELNRLMTIADEKAAVEDKEKIKEEDVVGKKSDPSVFLEEFLNDFEVRGSFIKIYKRRYGRKKALPTPHTLAADLLDMGSGISNDRFASYIAEEYQAELEAEGYLDDGGSSTMRSDLTMERKKGGRSRSEISLENDDGRIELGGVRKEVDVAGVDLDGTIDEMINREMKMRLLDRLGIGQSTGGTQGDNRTQGDLTKEDVIEVMKEMRSQEEKQSEKSAMIDTLKGISEGMKNLNQRISALEKEPPKGVPRSERNEGNLIDKEARGAMTKMITERLEGKGKESINKKDIEGIIKTTAESLNPPAPPGEKNQYDMETEKAKTLAGARKTEAEEKRKGFEAIAEAIASSIPDGLGNLGFNIGVGAAEGSSGRKPGGSGVKKNSEVRMSPEEIEERTAPPVDVNENGLGNCSACGQRVDFKDRARVMCPACGAILSRLTEEEKKDQKEEKTILETEEITEESIEPEGEETVERDREEE